MMTPRVVDLSHHNIGPLDGHRIDFAAMAAAGIWGVIHKASQGAAYRDPKYRERRTAATAAGLFWGAYHFNTGDSPMAQVENFITAAAPDTDTLMVLDYEDNRLSNMGIAQAVAFLRTIEQRLGRKAAIYSGNRLKENIARLNAADRAYVTSHRLWLCQYGPRAVLPQGFDRYWLWQFTDGQIGPTPHSIAGVSGSGIDLNVYEGDQAQLAAEWH